MEMDLIWLHDNIVLEKNIFLQNLSQYIVHIGWYELNFHAL